MRRNIRALLLMSGIGACFAYLCGAILHAILFFRTSSTVRHRIPILYNPHPSSLRYEHFTVVPCLARFVPIHWHRNQRSFPTPVFGTSRPSSQHPTWKSIIPANRSPSTLLLGFVTADVLLLPFFIASPPLLFVPPTSISSLLRVPPNGQRFGCLINARLCDSSFIPPPASPFSPSRLLVIPIVP